MERRERIVIIGAGDLQKPLVQKAIEKGYETHVFAWEAGAVCKEISNYFYPISITEKEKILAICQTIKPKAIVSIGSDLAVLTVNFIARKLGLICNPEITDIVSTNKYEMRKAFSRYQIPIPKYEIVDENFCEEKLNTFKLPIIVKSTDRSGSRGITKLLDLSQLESAVEKAKKESFEKKAIIEEFIGGKEYSCECITYQGKHHFLSFTKKYTTGHPNYIECAHLEPSDLDKDMQKKIKCLVFKALDALEIQYGASHTEFKVTDEGEIKFIEIGSRMGGDHIGSDMVQISTGYDYLDMVIDVAAGKELKLEKKEATKIAIVRYILGKEDINLLNHIKEKYPRLLYQEVEINFDDSRVIADSSARFGQFILACDTIDEAIKFLPIEKY